MTKLVSIILFGLILSGFPKAQVFAGDCVVLLHGLARSASSMEKMEKRLIQENYKVVNIDYPSRKHPIEKLAPMAVGQGIESCRGKGVEKIHFVTHSLGGILVRVYFSLHRRPDLGRVVMLAPPNQGSEVVDNIRDMPGYYFVNGPAGMQLGTGAGDLPRKLGPVDFDLGVIAGTQSINLILSTYLPNPDDGKVSLESTKVQGMKDFLAVPSSHPFIMKNDTVLEQVVYFLRTGRFQKKSQQQPTDLK